MKQIARILLAVALLIPSFGAASPILPPGSGAETIGGGAAASADAVSAAPTDTLLIRRPDGSLLLEGYVDSSGKSNWWAGVPTLYGDNSIRIAAPGGVVDSRTPISMALLNFEEPSCPTQPRYELIGASLPLALSGGPKTDAWGNLIGGDWGETCQNGVDLASGRDGSSYQIARDTANQQNEVDAGIENSWAYPLGLFGYSAAERSYGFVKPFVDWADYTCDYADVGLFGYSYDDFEGKWGAKAFQESPIRHLKERVVTPFLASIVRLPWDLPAATTALYHNPTSLDQWGETAGVYSNAFFLTAGGLKGAGVEGPRFGVSYRQLSPGQIAALESSNGPRMLRSQVLSSEPLAASGAGNTLESSVLKGGAPFGSAFAGRPRILLSPGSEFDGGSIGGGPTLVNRQSRTEGIRHLDEEALARLRERSQGSNDMAIRGHWGAERLKLVTPINWARHASLANVFERISPDEAIGHIEANGGGLVSWAPLVNGVRISKVSAAKWYYHAVDPLHHAAYYIANTGKFRVASELSGVRRIVASQVGPTLRANGVTSFQGYILLGDLAAANSLGLDVFDFFAPAYRGRLQTVELQTRAAPVLGFQKVEVFPDLTKITSSTHGIAKIDFLGEFTPTPQLTLEGLSDLLRLGPPSR